MLEHIRFHYSGIVGNRGRIDRVARNTRLLGPLHQGSRDRPDLGLAHFRYAMLRLPNQGHPSYRDNKNPIAFHTNQGPESEPIVESD